MATSANQPSLADLIQQQIAAGIASRQQVTQQAQETFRTQERGVEKIASIYDTVAQAQTTAVQESTASERALQDRNLAVLQAAGGDQAQLARISTLNRGLDTIQAKTAELVRKQNRSIFDLVSDPVETIKDFVTLDQTRDELQGEVLKNTTLAGQMSLIDREVKNALANNNTVGRVVSAAEAKAKADIASAAAQVAAEQARIEGAKYNLLKVQAIADADEATLNYLLKGHATVKSEEELALRRSADRRDAERLALAKWEKAERERQKAEGVSEVAFYSEALKRGYIANGITPPDADILKSTVRVALSNPNSPQAHYLTTGMLNMSQGAASQTIARQPSDAYVTLEKGLTRLPETAKGATDILRKANEVLGKSPATPSRKKDPAAWADAYDRATDAVMADFQAQIVSGSRNPFDVSGSIATNIQKIPQLAQLPLTQKFLVPLVNAGSDVGDPTLVLKRGVAAVAAGQLSSEELIAGITKIYQVSSAMNWQAGRFGDLGLQAPPGKGLQYNVPLPGKVFGTTTVDLHNPTDVRKWVASHLASAQLDLKNEAFRTQNRNMFGLK